MDIADLIIFPYRTMDTSLGIASSNLPLGATSRRVIKLRDLANLQLRCSILVHPVVF